MQHVPAVVVGHLNGREQNVPCPRTDGLVRFDATKTSVAITGVSKARDKKPFQGVLSLIKGITRGPTLSLELTSTFDEWSHNPAQKPLMAGASVHLKPRDRQRFSMWQRKQAMAKAFNVCCPFIGGELCLQTFSFS